jgi:hypothetical protein
VNDQFDRRAERAADAVRERAMQVVPPGVPVARRSRLIAAVVLVMVLVAGIAFATLGRDEDSTDLATTPAARAARAAEVVDQLRAGDYEDVRRDFDDRMTNELPVDKLRAAWIQFEAMFGTYRSHGEAVATTFGASHVVTLPLQMANRPGELRITFSDDGRVVGLFLLQAGTPLPSG